MIFDCNVGDAVLYYKSDSHIELGIIKSFNSQGVPFVQYHIGSTGACTPWHLLRPIQNEHAFNIIKLDANEDIQTQHARQIAADILDVVESQFMDDIIKLSQMPILDEDHPDYNGNTVIRGELYSNMESSITNLIETTASRLKGENK